MARVGDEIFRELQHTFSSGGRSPYHRVAETRRSPAGFTGDLVNRVPRPQEGGCVPELVRLEAEPFPDAPYSLIEGATTIPLSVTVLGVEAEVDEVSASLGDDACGQ